MTFPARFFTNTVTVRTKTGFDSYGDTFADPVDVVCQWVDGNKLVTDARGEQVTSTASIRGYVADAALFALGSTVDYGGRRTRVIETRLVTGLTVTEHLYAALA